MTIVKIADLLRFAIDVVERHNLRYMLVGSMASINYGEPRLTNDVDLVVELGLDSVESFCAEFSDGEFYISVDAARRAVLEGRQFNVVHYLSACKIDIMFPRRDAWGEQQLRNRVRRRILPGIDGFVASPEDVVLGKLWYYQVGESEKHLRDIMGILRAGNVTVDESYINEWANRLGLSNEWELVLEKLREISNE